jgi:hypothetical protein
MASIMLGFRNWPYSVCKNLSSRSFHITRVWCEKGLDLGLCFRHDNIALEVSLALEGDTICDALALNIAYPYAYLL